MTSTEREIPDQRPAVYSAVRDPGDPIMRARAAVAEAHQVVAGGERGHCDEVRWATGLGLCPTWVASRVTLREVTPSVDDPVATPAADPVATPDGDPVDRAREAVTRAHERVSAGEGRHAHAEEAAHAGRLAWCHIEDQAAGHAASWGAE
ncbi:MAG: hypothetical protein LC749_17080 [Actinobacteria bacterium]|nr:hypothetical protein [Actinomycetota bacterium]